MHYLGSNQAYIPAYKLSKLLLYMQTQAAEQHTNYSTTTVYIKQGIIWEKGVVDTLVP